MFGSSRTVAIHMGYDYPLYVDWAVMVQKCGRYEKLMKQIAPFLSDSVERKIQENVHIESDELKGIPYDTVRKFVDVLHGKRETFSNIEHVMILRKVFQCHDALPGIRYEINGNEITSESWEMNNSLKIEERAEIFGPHFAALVATPELLEKVFTWDLASIEAVIEKYRSCKHENDEYNTTLRKFIVQVCNLPETAPNRRSLLHLANCIDWTYGTAEEVEIIIREMAKDETIYAHVSVKAMKKLCDKINELKQRLDGNSE